MKISKAQKGMLDIIKNLENVDKLDTAEVIFTDLKQGIFNLQAKFWMKVARIWFS
jgi:small conductance mechanosensitive channel